MSIVDFAELYPRLYPVIALRPHGKLSDWWIFKSYKSGFKIPNVDYPKNPNRFRQGGHSGLIVAKLYYPENPRTSHQQGNRTVFYDAVKNWQGFDDPTKQYYNQFAKGRPISGYTRYIQLYLGANLPMIIYWETLKQSASEAVTIPDYIASAYFRSNAKKSAICLDLDGAGSAITPGIKADLRIPFNCVIKNWTLLSDITGTLKIDVWKDTYANFPPTDADSICPGSEPYIYLENKRQNLTASGFYPQVSAGDVFRFYVDAAVAATRCHLNIEVEKD
jgi:hypothetical protein